jgi:hypothetical protein
MSAAKLARVADWRARLKDCIRARSSRDFAPGEMDCALFAADVVAAMTGRDFAAAYRGTYTTEAAGIRRLRSNKHRDHVALAAKWLPEIAVADARPGDLAVIEYPGGALPALAVVLGENICSAGPSGLVINPRAKASRAFRVGN